MLGANALPVRPASAADERAGETTRLELQLAAGWRQDTLAVARVQATATGDALSDLSARGAWFRPGRWLGLAGRLSTARFTLTAPPGMVEPERVTLNGLEAVGALAVRARPSAWLSFEGQLGYGVYRLPVAALAVGPAGNLRLGAGQLSGHGPTLNGGARLVAGRMGLELGIDLGPRVFGASYGGGAVSTGQLGGRAGASLDLRQAAGLRWTGLIEYQLARIAATGTGVDIAQGRQLVALGLRVCWGPASPTVATPPPPPPAPPAPPPEPAASAISGLVRAEDGQPVAARITVPELGLELQADAGGAFRLEVRPGRYTLNIEAVGYLPQSKPISASAGEQRIYNIDLQRETR